MILRRHVTVIPVSGAPTRPWRNGSGRTTSLYAHMPDAESEPWWTLSLASLERSAAFSTFPGYDRQLVNAGRASVELDIDGRRGPVHHGDIAAFPGESQVRVFVDHGCSAALNLMTRREACRGDLSVGNIDGDQLVDPRQVTALVLLRGALDVSGTTICSCGDTVVAGDSPIVVTGDSAVVARIRVD